MKPTKNKTVLERVKGVPITGSGRQSILAPDSDTAIAWLKGEVKLVQISKTLWPGNKNTGTRAYLFLNHSIKQAYQEGKLQVAE
jgi:hypothetical protein